MICSKTSITAKFIKVQALRPQSLYQALTEYYVVEGRMPCAIAVITKL